MGIFSHKTHKGGWRPFYDFGRWRSRNKTLATLLDVALPGSFIIGRISRNTFRGMTRGQVAGALLGDLGALVSVAGFLTAQPELVALGGAMIVGGRVAASGELTAQDASDLAAGYESAQGSGSIATAERALSAMSKSEQWQALEYGRYLATSGAPIPPAPRGVARTQPRPASPGLTGLFGRGI